MTKSKTGLTLKERMLRSKKPKIIAEFFKGENNAYDKNDNNDSKHCLKRAIIVNSDEKVEHYKNIHLNVNPGITFYQRFTQPTQENILKHLNYAIKSKNCKFIVVYLNNFKIGQTLKFYKLMCKAKRKHFIVISKYYTDFLLKYRVTTRTGTVKLNNAYDKSTSNIISIVGDLNVLNCDNLNELLKRKDTQFNKNHLNANFMLYRPK